jgi:class 3 adenylate cyclase
VHIGARVSALAGPNDVLVSSTLRDLVIGSGIEFDEARLLRDSRACRASGAFLPSPLHKERDGADDSAVTGARLGGSALVAIV